MSKPIHRAALAAFLTIFSAASLAGAQEAAEEPRIAYTKPYAETDLSFGAPGLIKKVNVKIGDEVKVGQSLAEQDITVEVAEQKPLMIEANSDVQRRYALADQGVKEKKLERVKKLHATGSANISELEEAQLEVERAKASVELADRDAQIAKAKADAIQARIDLKTIKSELNGRVTAVEIEPGEISNGDTNAKPAISVVQNNPLKIDASIPYAISRTWTKGQEVAVRYTDDKKGVWRTAKVLNLNDKVLPIQEQIVQLELPNDENHPSGLQVEIQLSQPKVAQNDAR